MRTFVATIVTVSFYLFGNSYTSFADTSQCLAEARRAYLSELESGYRVTKFSPLSRESAVRLLLNEGINGRSLRRAIRVIDENAGLMFEVDTESYGGYKKEIVFSWSSRRNCLLKKVRLTVAED